MTINFRATSGFVTDQAGETFSLGEQYPVTRGGLTFGWATNLTANARDRNSGIDRRLAGLMQLANSLGTTTTFRLDLPNGPGTYTVRLALGDDAANQDIRVRVRDGTGGTVLATIQDSTLSASEWFDATGVRRTSAALWVANNASTNLTFTANHLILEIGAHPSGLGSSVISHLFVQAVSSGPTFTTQPGNQTVTAPNTAGFAWASNGTITGFQVQQRRGGGAWTNVPDGTGASGGAGTNVSGTYTTTATAVSTGNHRNGDEYRVVLDPGGTPVNSNAALLTVNEPTATQLVLSVPDAAGLSGFNGFVLSAAAPGAGVTVIATPTGITFNGSGQATINVTGLGIPVGARRWVSVTNSTGDPAQSPAPVQAQGPVTAS